MQEDVEFRHGLPRDFLEHLGVAHCDRISEKRKMFLNKLRILTDKLFRYAPVDAAADQLGKQLVHDALPPMLETGKLLTVLVAKKVQVVEQRIHS